MTGYEVITKKAQKILKELDDSCKTSKEYTGWSCLQSYNYSCAQVYDKICSSPLASQDPLLKNKVDAFLGLFFIYVNSAVERLKMLSNKELDTDLTLASLLCTPESSGLFTVQYYYDYHGLNEENGDFIFNIRYTSSTYDELYTYISEVDCRDWFKSSPIGEGDLIFCRIKVECVNRYKTALSGECSDNTILGALNKIRSSLGV